MYKERIRKILTGMLVLCMVFAMNGFTSVSAAKKVAATKVTITNAYTVMAVGQSANFDCKLTPSKSTDKVTWKSSNESIASPDANGKFTAKKSGTVTITATATSGVKSSVKVLVVSKNGVTSLQSRVDKMLAASNIKKITIKNLKTEESYTIAEGNYSKKTLTINAPLSDVVNYGRFKNIVINDVKNGTYVEMANGNKFDINDEELTFKVGEGASVHTLNVGSDNKELNMNVEGKVISMNVNGDSDVKVEGSGKIANLNIKGDANVKIGADNTVDKVTVAGDAKNVKLTVDGTVKKIVVTEPTNLVIEGDAENVQIVVSAAAEGTTITTSVPVKITTEAKITVVLNEGSEGSSIKTTDETIEVVLKNNTTATVEIKKGNTVVEEQPTVTTTPTTTPSSTTPSTSTTTTTVNGTVSGSAVNYTLPVAFENLKAAKVNVNVAMLNSTLDVSDSLAYVNKLLANDATTIANWKNTTERTIQRSGLEVKVTGEKGSDTKVVEFKNVKFTVTVNGTNGNDAEISVQREGSSNVYVLTKSADNKTLTITSSSVSVDTIKNMVSFTVTY